MPSGQTQIVQFGAGLRHKTAPVLASLNAKRAMVLSTPHQSASATELAATLGNRVAGIYARATMHTPTEVTEDALAHAKAVGADCFVAIGGGSTIGLGKALALRTSLPHIVLPTTYAGSEATPILGQTENGVKTTLSDPAVLPNVILYDPELVATLPSDLTVTSGLNAMAHAVEALYAKDRNEQSTALAEQGLAAFATGLPEVVAHPEDISAREDTLRGAYACGAVLGQVGMALHHKLCHSLGGAFDLPHAQTHAIILPHSTHFNSMEVGQLLEPVMRVLEGSDPGTALWDFAKHLKAPLALRELGLLESDLDKATDLALSKPYWNPRELTRDGIRQLLQNAWSGEAPGS